MAGLAPGNLPGGGSRCSNFCAFLGVFRSAKISVRPGRTPFRPGEEGGGSLRADRAALTFDFAENVDLDGAGKHLPPSLQEGLQPGITGDLLAACLQ
jgi:hypothetical protein